jgi:predicted O-methyltransferase YrrM
MHALLEELYASGEIVLGDGSRQPLHSQITRENAEGLERAVRMLRPERVLEIGMAFGISSLAILSALEELGGPGALVSIDPFERERYADGGLALVARAGLAKRHQLLREPDYLVLPALLAAGRRYDLVYVDGHHSFDYVLLDFFYADLLLPVGGVVGFDDCGWPSVARVLRFIRSHKDYVEIDVGIPPDYSARNPLFSLGRRLLGRNRADRYFRKRSERTPANNFYTRF